MTGKIFVLQENGALLSMEESSYVSEDQLQSLLAQYPDLLAGEQIDEGEPRRWLLLSREVGVTFEEGDREWLSLDHLFVDQDAIPTLVEVKRSGDTRLRREVVGQMLDYASNAVAYWSVQRLRDRYELACGEVGDDPFQSIGRFLQVLDTQPAQVEDFWQRIATTQPLIVL